MQPYTSFLLLLMQRLPYQLRTAVSTLLLLLITQLLSAQNVKLSDFAIWGGGASPNPYNSAQGVFINNAANIQGNIGSNHLVDIKNNLVLQGNIYSSNRVLIGNTATITGNVFANRMGTSITPAISSGNNLAFTGNLTANGRITLGNGKVTGKVAVPAPANTNYTGPVPTGGVGTSVTLPVLPTMPNNAAFDNQVGTTTINNTQTLLPGKYRKLALTGNKTITFDGPGNYIFYEVDNGNSSNKFIFDLKGTTTGSINLFIIKDARWGTLSVRAVNGNFPSRIYTEVHGNGSTFGGNAFTVKGANPMPAGSNVWLGNVWAPAGGISIESTAASTNPDIIGALWSGKSVSLANDFRLAYITPAATPSYVKPYYPPPSAGKVDVANTKIGAELLSLFQNPNPITGISKNEIFRFDNAGRVMIEVISDAPRDVTLRAQLESAGMTGIVNNGPAIFVISGFFPISNIPLLNGFDRIRYVRPLFPPLTNGGQVTTQGDSTMRSNNVRSRFGVDGTGVKIGVISDSYNSKLTAQNDVDQGDLPGIKSNTILPPNQNTTPVQAPFPELISGSDEGRAMLQIVHDVAPMSKLAFRTGFLTAGDFARSIQEMASPDFPGGRCDVIVDDITYITEPFLRDGTVARTVNEVVTGGVTYVTSAGNFGTQSHEDVFKGVVNTAVIPTGQIHQFGATPADIYQTVNLKPGSYTIVLQWSDEFKSLGTAGVDTDMDLYLVGTSGYTLFGFNRSNISGDPFEVCPFTVTEETNAKLMVVRAEGTNNVRFKYIIFRGGPTLVDYQIGTSSIVGHPNADSAIAVGAMLYRNFPGITTVWPGVASFSSRGGTVTQPLGGGGGLRRNKPEIIGPNGVNTTVNLGSPRFEDGDDYPNFFGTSAAAPHVAAVAGLLIEGRKKYNLQTTVSPSEIRRQLVSSAGPFTYLENFSYEGGYGFAQADSAMAQVANARPIISSLAAVIPGAQNGSLPFQVKVTGAYLTPATQIYFDGEPMVTTISPDKTQAIATVPAIANGQDPPFQLFNPPKSPSGLDGGLSEELHFFSSIVDITVRAANKTRKYGQNNPVFTAEILYNGVLMTNPDTLSKLKLDGANLRFSTIASPTITAGLYGIFPSRTTPLADNDPLHSGYRFTFIQGTLTVGKMPLRITPNNKIVRYGEDIGEISYTYSFDSSLREAGTMRREIEALHKKYLASNALVVLHEFNDPESGLTYADLSNMSMMASFQSIRNARRFVLRDGRLTTLTGQLTPAQIGDQRFIVDASAQSLRNYKRDSLQSRLVTGFGESHARAFVNIKGLAAGNAKAIFGPRTPQPLMNGQLLAMVNGQLQALVNGQLQALVNGTYVAAEDIVFQNGQLVALVNGQWVVTTNGQLVALVNGLQVDVKLSVANGQLQALVNGQLMALVNGQLQAIVNGQLLAIVNGQLQALVNGQVMPVLNGQLVAMVNGQLQAMVNGQLLAMVNGQLMADVDDTLRTIDELSLSNGQLQAMVNGQLQALVNGQLKAMVNGVVTNIPTTGLNMVNGQLQAMVNGQLQALVNGQLQALVNGQLQALVNGAAVEATNARRLANGQLQALVNGTYIPLANGQLQAIVNGNPGSLVNGQLLAMVNGQLMATIGNTPPAGDSLTFVVFANGQLLALVNGQLQALVNGQLQAMVNGSLATVNSYSVNDQGQLLVQANGQTLAYANGQLLALVNGQLQALVNNFDVSGTNNNSQTLVLIDQDDVTVQAGALGGMFSVNMITGLEAGPQKLVPGAFVNENFEVTYGVGNIEIRPALLAVVADDTTKVYGDDNPEFTVSYFGLAYDDNAGDINAPETRTVAGNTSGVGTYPIVLGGGSASNYTLLLRDGNLVVTKKPLKVIADDKSRIIGTDNPPFTITYNGLVGNDTKDSVCLPYIIPASPRDIQQLNRKTTYTDVKLNGQTNVINATPGQTIQLTGNYNSVYSDPTDYCPGCITQLHIGMSNGKGGNLFNDCIAVGQAPSGSINKTFTAPSAPGVYYITQESTWWFYCGQFADPTHINVPDYAIAVVVVNISKESITASTEANVESAQGTYTITLLGCSNYNPNYDVTLQNGKLTISGTRLGARIPAGAEIKDVNAEGGSNKIYPNPASSMVRLQTKDDVQRTNDIQVFDVLGKLVMAPVKKYSERMYDVNVSSLSKGVYYIKVKTSAGITTFKFMKIE
ncbi:MAG TPA: MBG domain-containing protein [Chitinophagaceae bacterium]|nr:MBG domain-containing protein [Chitinophagaceae bacterium]